MIIDREWLEARHACEDGLKWFCKRFPNGLDTGDRNQIARWTEKNHLVDLIQVLAADLDSFGACCRRTGTFDSTELLPGLADYLGTSRVIGLRDPQVRLYQKLMKMPLYRLHTALYEIAAAREAYDNR